VAETICVLITTMYRLCSCTEQENIVEYGAVTIVLTTQCIF